MLERRKEERLIAFIRENQQHFYRIAYSYVKNPDTALDLVQDAIVKAIQKQDSLRNPDAVKTWFYRILVNECLANLRRGKRFSFGSLEVCADTPAPEREDHSDLYEAMESLPPVLKTVILLRFFEDLKLEEIAAVTGARLSTVKSRLYKALRMLKMEMEAENLDG
ncbi:MAG: RNA polymerase sigma factor [Candidatus Merdivicinus sp.]